MVLAMNHANWRTRMDPYPGCQCCLPLLETRNTIYREAEHVYNTETLSTFKSERKLLVRACLASFYAISNMSTNARPGLLSEKQTQAGSRWVYGYRLPALMMNYYDHSNQGSCDGILPTRATGLLGHILEGRDAQEREQ